MNKLKLNTVLGKTEHLSQPFKQSIKDYTQFFKDKQTAFRGEKKTYDPKNGTVDIPSERGNKLVVTTVKEKLDWLKETNKEYIDLLFSQEATNASGKAKATLTVDGIEFGEFSSLELLRLKSVIENGELEQMYSNIPVRNDDEEWTATTEEMYQGKDIFENKKQTGTKKSIVKESYVMMDPNVKDLKDSSSYKAPIGSKDTVMELGDYTYQKFTGEISHRERAELLRRRSKFLSAVIEALKVSNETEVVESNMTADKLFNYLHTGKIVNN
jgi:hypothetical protein